MLTKLEVGKPYPGPVPKSEGCVLEMTDNGGLICLIQLPGLKRAEKQAFKKSFSKYAYLETGTTPPVAMWVWCWPDPMGWMDCNFDGSLVSQNAIDEFMALEDGQVKNMIQFHLLDGRLLAGIKIVGLEHEAVRMFRDTIQKQRAMKYSRFEFNQALDGIYAFSTDEIYEMGTKFRK